jgi:hypothetical protein
MLKTVYLKMRVVILLKKAEIAKSRCGQMKGIATNLQRTKIPTNAPKFVDWM